MHVSIGITLTQPRNCLLLVPAVYLPGFFKVSPLPVVLANRQSATAQVRDVLRKAGIEAMIGKFGRSTTIHAVIEEWQSSRSG